MTASISRALREEVRHRTGGRCEYCLIHEDDVLLSHEPDHIIAIKHGGETAIDNLGWACFLCNRYKGSDIASIDPQTSQLTALFHPRRDHWSEHFQLRNGRIEAMSPTGRATAAILRFNTPQNIELRRLLQAAGRIP